MTGIKKKRHELLKLHKINEAVGAIKKVARQPSDVSKSTVQEEEEEEEEEEDNDNGEEYDEGNISNNSGLNDGEYNGDGDGDGDDYYGDRDDESMGLTEKEENEFGGLGTLRAYPPPRPRADATNVNTARLPRYQQQQQQQQQKKFSLPIQYYMQPDLRVGMSSEIQEYSFINSLIHLLSLYFIKNVHTHTHTHTHTLTHF